MQQFSATHAKQAFGELLEAAARGPVAIEKHAKVKAIIAAPEFFSAPQAPAQPSTPPAADRLAARARQALVDKERLIKHQRMAIALLTRPAPERKALVQGARRVVARWRAERLCSQDYIDRWEALLALPHRELALAMVSDADGWGPSLRQNSPWPGAAP